MSIEDINSTVNNAKSDTLVPLPLQRTLPVPEPFPVHVLGNILEPLICKIAEVIQAPIGICGQSVLASVALAVQGYADIVVDGRIIPLSEFFLTMQRKFISQSDCGGSNSRRSRLWKMELQKLADRIHMDIHVSHFPPGTSKWNNIEHKMFSFISINWRGRPLTTYNVIVNLISNTKNKTGLEIFAELDENVYAKGIKISDEDFKSIKLKKCKFHGEWNYIIKCRD